MAYSSGSGNNLFSSRQCFPSSTVSPKLKCPSSELNLQPKYPCPEPNLQSEYLYPEQNFEPKYPFPGENFHSPIYTTLQSSPRKKSCTTNMQSPPCRRNMYGRLSQKNSPHSAGNKSCGMAVNLLSVSGGWGSNEENGGAESEITAKLNTVHIEKSTDEKPDEPEKKEKEETATTTPEEELSKAEVSLLAKITRSKLVTTKADIEVQRKDPFSPLHSVKTFEALHLKPNLLKGVYEMGFNAPSKIQETALPILLADPPQNMIAQSQSGTGKTAAFVLAMLSRVNSQLNYPQVLCLSPTYELAIQTGEVAAKMGQFCEDIQIRYAVRGEDLPRGSKLTEHIVIGTPGKVLDWSIKYKFFDLSKITVFVLDEADVMIATQGHQDQSFRIRRLVKENQCQIMLFSATYDDEVMDFAQAIVPNPIIIRLKREEESLDNIKQYYVICESEEEKYNAIANIYGGITVGQVMIFCQTRRTASWLSEKMTRDGHAVALLSGELTVEQRISVLDRFREGKEKVLITTNVLARGIDVEQVTIVVNFDLPLNDKGRADCETYLHRIGRTGRFGKRGLAINLVRKQEIKSTLRTIEEHFGKKISLLNTDDYDEVEKLNS